MLIAILPMLVLIVGLILYFAATQNGKVAEVGRILFWTGLAIMLWMLRDGLRI